MAKPNLSQEEQAALNEVLACHKLSEDYLQPYRSKCDELYSHYRGYTALADDLRKASPPDRDVRWRDAQSEWGSELVIPRAFEIVQTILPRAISNRPRSLVLPVDDLAERNVENMKYLIDHQAQQIQYDLKLEEVGLSGYTYGLGVQKLLWQTRYGQRPSMHRVPSIDSQGRMVPMWVEGDPEIERIFDDWTVETIDLADFFWDPFGYKLEEGAHGSCRFVIHRTRRDTRYCLDRIRERDWNTEAAEVLEEEDVRSLAGNRAWSDPFQNRAKADGMSTPNPDGIHEVWEWHHEDGRVITVLDRQIPVIVGRRNFRHGQMPFAVFRPAIAGQHTLAGIGVVEPLVPLLRELSLMRTQRRDNAALAMVKAFAFSDGAVDQNDLQLFPGAAIPVHGEPRDFLYPLDLGGDLPASSYNEEDRINQDIDRVSGISETLTGADPSSGGAAATATGVQLVQSAANIRIQRQTRRLEVELVTRETGQAVSLNQQKIIQAQQRKLKVPRLPEPGEIGPVWDTKLLTPLELEGRFVIEVEGGSMAPRNLPQLVQQAQSMQAMFANDPDVDQKQLKRKMLELIGVSHPEAFLVADTPPLDPDVLDRLEAAGVNRRVIEAAVAASQRENPPAGQAEDPQAGQPQQPQLPEQTGAAA